MNPAQHQIVAEAEWREHSGKAAGPPPPQQDAKTANTAIVFKIFDKKGATTRHTGEAQRIML